MNKSHSGLHMISMYHNWIRHRFRNSQ